MSVCQAPALNLSVELERRKLWMDGSLARELEEQLVLRAKGEGTCKWEQVFDVDFGKDMVPATAAKPVIACYGVVVERVLNGDEGVDETLLLKWVVQHVVASSDSVHLEEAMAMGPLIIEQDLLKRLSVAILTCKDRVLKGRLAKLFEPILMNLIESDGKTVWSAPSFLEYGMRALIELKIYLKRELDMIRRVIYSIIADPVALSGKCSHNSPNNLALEKLVRWLNKLYIGKKSEPPEIVSDVIGRVRHLQMVSDFMNADLDPSFAVFCKFCLKPRQDGKKLKQCTGCRKLTYCSENCQKRHWHEHKKQCRELQEWRKDPQKTMTADLLANEPKINPKAAR
mmetsp:Transcript_5727/g.10086  ORF Transcript_5727/g.10086 Transcript_5727/m.10086 type:complete len:341 (-) Transcript_5727:60-1082(-)